MWAMHGSASAMILRIRADSVANAWAGSRLQPRSSPASLPASWDRSRVFRPSEPSRRDQSGRERPSRRPETGRHTGDPFVPHQAAGRGGRSRPNPIRLDRPGHRAREGAFPERQPRNALRFKDIREVSSEEDKVRFEESKTAQRGCCPFHLLVRILERPGVTREPAARGRERDASSSRRSQGRTYRRRPPDPLAGGAGSGRGERHGSRPTARARRGRPRGSPT